MPFDALPACPLTADEEIDLLLLKAGRHRIRKKWLWWKGAAGNGPGSGRFFGACALLALSYAETAEKLGIRDNTRQLLRDHLPEWWVRREGWLAVAEFNDHPSTTHEDILALYDRAIASLEARRYVGVG